MLLLAKSYVHCRRVLWREESKELEETWDKWHNRILLVDLEEKTVRQEKKVIRMRQNTTDKPGKEQEKKEVEFKKEISGEYHNTIFDKKIFDKLSSWRPWYHTIKIILRTPLRDYRTYSLLVKEQ